MANWISVRKAKPAPLHRVLVINSVGYVCIGEYTLTRRLGSHWRTDAGNCLMGVRYWAALPSKPEGGGGMMDG